jgi:myo-inositol-1(or 4)-monophosphatase
MITEAGGLIGNFTGESDYLYQREVVAGCPKIYGQLVQMLTPFSRVIKDAKDGSEPVPELAEVTPETVLAASMVESADAPAPVKRVAVRLKKADSTPS